MAHRPLVQAYVVFRFREWLSFDVRTGTHPNDVYVRFCEDGHRSCDYSYVGLWRVMLCE